MHDNSHAETHYFCEQANAAQDVILFRDIFFADEPMISTPKVNIVDACRHFHAKKSDYSLQENDVLIPVVQGNLFDDQNDEYFYKTHLNYPQLPDLKEGARGVGILSLFYRMSPISEFLSPRNDLVKIRKEEWWDPKTNTEKDMLLSNLLLHLLLGLTGMLVANLKAHDDTRGCIMDYCQDTFETMIAFERGVDFSFCDRECRQIMEKSEFGKALIKIATHLTANPFGQPHPSIFISYAREDFSKSEKLRADLQAAGYQSVWKDTYEILGGEMWEPKIYSAMEKHDFIISCFSTAALSKPRFFKRELDVTLKLYHEKRTHLIPIRFDDCMLPEEIGPYHCYDLSTGWATGLNGIMKTITGTWKPFTTGSINPNRVINIRDAKARLSELLRQVERGQEITIARAGKPIARIVAIP